MLKIRLTQFGKRSAHTYRIIVKEARSKRQGDYTDLIGHYVDHPGQSVLHIDQEKLKNWQTKGAQMTPAVAALVNSQNTKTKTKSAAKA